MAFQIQSKDIVYGVRLGAGGFGEVYKATWEHIDVAVKQLILRNMSDPTTKDFEKEIEVHLKLRHPHIVQIYGVTAQQPYGMVMEYMENGSLDTYLHNNPRDNVSWMLKYKIAIAVCKGLSYLHKNNIIHRDLKSLNVLLNKFLEAKICDFGLAKVKTETTSRTQSTSPKGTLQWLAPELLKLKPTYNEKTDIYSYGIVLWELASHEYPYDGTPLDVIRSSVKDGERETFPENTPKDFEEIAKKCWDGDAKNRPELVSIIAILESLLALPNENSQVNSSTSTCQNNNNSGYLQSNTNNMESTDYLYSIANNYPSNNNSSYLQSTTIKNNLESSGYLNSLANNMGSVNNNSGYLQSTTILPELPKSKNSIKSKVQQDDINSKTLHSGHIEPIVQKVPSELPNLVQIKTRHQNVQLPDGSLYTGEMQNNLPHGKGHLKYIQPNEFLIYEGNFAQGKKNGRGHLIYANRDSYEGQWINDTMTGKGTYQYAQPNEFGFYVGDWINGKMHGFGKITYSNKANCPTAFKSYEGWWVSGKMHGSGTMIYGNGESVTGQWKDGNRVQSNSTEPIIQKPEPIIQKSTVKTVTINPNSLKRLCTLKGNKKDKFYCLEQLADGTILSGDEGNIKLWNKETESYLTIPYLFQVRVLTKLSDGTFASGSYQTIQLWNPKTLECLKKLEGHTSNVTSLIQLSNGTLASGSEDKSIKLWDPETGDCLKTFYTGWYVRALIEVSDGILASGSDYITLWDINKGEKIQESYYTNLIRALIKLSDGTLASGGDDNTIRLWNSQTLECLKTFKGHSEYIRALTQVSDDALASGSQDNTIKLWDLESGKCLRTIRGHKNHVCSLITLSCGTLASGSKDGTITLWG